MMERQRTYLLVLLLLGMIGICGAQFHCMGDPEPQGIIPVYKEESSYLYSFLTFGTPPQDQRMILDTELDFTLLVDARSCPNGTNCFHEEDSSTSVETFLTINHFCEVMEDQVGFQGVNYTTLSRYCLSNYDAAVIGKMATVDGYLGMGYLTNGESKSFYFIQLINMKSKSSNSFYEDLFNPFTDLFEPSWSPVYALDFQREEKYLHLGGYQHQSELAWSEKQTDVDTADPVFIEAPLYRITMCGQPLQVDVAFTIGQVVTSHNCLGLSRDIYASVLDWLSDDCTEQAAMDLSRGTIFCNFKKREQVDNLPVISFQLDINEDSKVFHIPLASLVTSVEFQRVGEHFYYQTSLCLIRSNRYSSHSSSKIILGALPLEQFYTVVNMRDNRVGLYQNQTSLVGETCPPIFECIGDQTYLPSSNQCEDPLCRIYQIVDNDTKTCVPSIMVISILAVILILVSMSDFLLSEWRLRLEKKLVQRIEN